MQQLLKEARSCKFCEKHLPLGPKPIVEATKNSKIVLISQAPGRIVHQTGVAWNDQSGKKLREWLGVDETTFYDTDNFAILPMGFCYPGKAKTGDAPPRKECAPMWHDPILSELKNIHLKILIGAYAASYYLPGNLNLTQRVSSYKDFLPKYWCLPHPSPVNRFWRSKNPWFEKDVVPSLQARVNKILD
ncbi:uracil-DNA glycosylase family protein [Salegentibacter sp. LM13S]|uniref:uracil-DNA glycosylase family protein n=1 Tax=Salegentibacter lacus TaxID=2873599 RepID=UPI001CD00A6F|nr:uracil-DNA glycosylase family protein [Salegentibacter lacus]MBZ9629621.1 uracil-DNA glycosylase family protein [Salegentibacter lacus]